MTALSLKPRLASGYDEAVALRRRIHANPELSGEEIETSALVKEQLAALGWTDIPLGLPTGCAAILNADRQARGLIALRADLDALPVDEHSGLAFTSKRKGIAHCCGHDLHTASLLLTARVLAEVKDELDGGVLLVFQPAEEKLDGAKALLDSGLFEQYRPSMILALHTWPFLTQGSVGILHHECMASSSGFTVTIKGKGGHGAHPEDCIDPIVAAAHLISLMQTLVSRTLAPLDSAVVTVGSIHGGTAANIIPESVSLEGTMRTCSPQTQEKLTQALEKLVQGTAAAFGCRADLTVTEGCPPLVNDPTVARKVEAAAIKILGADRVVTLPKPSMGSEDFARYLLRFPGALFRIGTACDDPESRLGLHNPNIRFGEEAILAGASVLCQTVVDELGHK